MLLHISEVIEQFAVDEAEATADLLGEAAFSGVAEELGVVVGDVALSVEEKAEDAVLENGEAATEIKA